MALRNIRVEEGFLSKGASVTMKQTFDSVQSKKIKRRKLKSVQYLRTVRSRQSTRLVFIQYEFER